MKMKALTLTQPWATLVALREKRVETRSWATNYEGPLAIHAAKGFPGWAKETCEYEEPFFTSLQSGGISTVKQLPLGKMLCIVKLLGCRRTEDVRAQLDEKELTFGDYSDGRFAWFFEFVEIIPEQPIAIGHLGLWEWSR